MQLWPIQCIAHACGNGTPFLVGAFAGLSKPASSREFLRPFVVELQELISEGVAVDGSVAQVSVKAIICDAPARAFVMATKGHGGYSGCPKCTVEGTYMNGKVVFLEMDCPLRTNISFREQHDSEHHKGDSILLDLPIDCVDDVPLDYMHLVLLGVVKKLLTLWTSGPLAVRFGPLQRQTFNEKSNLVRASVPSEFHRKPRGLDELDRWKAVEFRLFLFYTGPFILKFCLTDRLYQHFLVLHTSLSVLANPQLCRQHAVFAGELLRCFVRDFRDFYGDEHVSFNVHCLIHLFADVQRYGHLDSFSAFPFENHMQTIKRQLRKHGKPLQQLYNRLVESQSEANIVHPLDEKPALLRQHTHGLLLPGCCPPQYKMLSFREFTISLSDKDCCFLQNGHVVLAKNIAHLKASNEPCIIGPEFLVKEDWYTVPFSSSRLCICVVSSLSHPKIWHVRNLQKMVMFPFGNKYIVFPQLHTA
ncbi:uncharacterized protein LOC142568577 [Dermacentor variabilis]|uniref:uncharacterized protein LOC142568577 n=1 Tax=Dermacentor variabilis TaxID=34621 RepID=UPI003F5C41E6